jgi:hypothetical protein
MPHDATGLVTGAGGILGHHLVTCRLLVASMKCMPWQRIWMAWATFRRITQRASGPASS